MNYSRTTKLSSYRSVPELKRSLSTRDCFDISFGSDSSHHHDATGTNTSGMTVNNICPARVVNATLKKSQSLSHKQRQTQRTYRYSEVSEAIPEGKTSIQRSALRQETPILSHPSRSGNKPGTRSREASAARRAARHATFHLDKSLPPLPTLTDSSWTSPDEFDEELDVPPAVKRAIPASSPLIHINNNSSNLYMFESMKDFETFTTTFSLPQADIIYDYDPRASVYQFDDRVDVDNETARTPAGACSPKKKPKKKKKVTNALPITKNAAVASPMRQKKNMAAKTKIPEEENEDSRRYSPKFASLPTTLNSDTGMQTKLESKKAREVELHKYLAAAADPSIYTTKPLRIASMVSRQSTSTSMVSSKETLQTTLNSQRFSDRNSQRSDGFTVPPLSIRRLSVHHWKCLETDEHTTIERPGSPNLSKLSPKKVPAIPPRNASRLFLSSERMSSMYSPSMSFQDSLSRAKAWGHSQNFSPHKRQESTLSLRKSNSTGSLRSRRSFTSGLEISIPAVAAPATIETTQTVDEDNDSSGTPNVESVVQAFISEDLAALDAALSFDMFEPNLYVPSSTEHSPISSYISTPAQRTTYNPATTSPSAASFVTAATSPSVTSQLSGFTENLSRNPSDFTSSIPSSPFSVYTDIYSDSSNMPSPNVNSFRSSLYAKCQSSPSLAFSAPGNSSFPVETPQKKVKRYRLAEANVTPAVTIISGDEDEAVMPKKQSISNRFRLFTRKIRISSGLLSIREDGRK